MSDVFRIKTLCEATPNTAWWYRLGAWRNKGLKQLIEDVLFPLKNVINASLDPSNTKEEEQLLKDSGWATMCFGDDTRTTSSVGDEDTFVLEYARS